MAWREADKATCAVDIRHFVLVVEGGDVPGAQAMRTRVHPHMGSFDSAVPKLRAGALDMVFVHYEAGGWQHYRSVCFADGAPWRVGADARRRVERLVADCEVCRALSRGRRDVARALMISMLDTDASLDDVLALLL